MWFGFICKADDVAIDIRLKTDKTPQVKCPTCKKVMEFRASWSDSGARWKAKHEAVEEVIDRMTKIGLAREWSISFVKHHGEAFAGELCASIEAQFKGK